MDDIDSLYDFIVNKIAHINLMEIAPQIREILQTSISYNFESGGRFGSANFYGGGTNKWKPSKRALKQGGQTLVDTGQLAASIRVHITSINNGLKIEIGSNKSYANIHQFGGKGNRAYIVARPFIVIQNEDLDQIERLVIKYVKSKLSNL